MYTIKQAAQRAGLSVPTVRAWERRYGVVHPVRTTAGYRLYDAEAIARLVAMRHLVEGRGLRPSQAADQLLSPGFDIAALAADAASRPDAAEDGRGDRGEVDFASFLDAAIDLDIPRMEAILDEWFAAARFEAAMEKAVFPALRAIGEAWSSGEVDPAMEHAASETIRRRLAHFFDAAAANGTGRPIVIGLPPGGHHEIGALAFGTAARRGGLDVIYLGANVPVESWLTAVRTAGARIAVIGAVSPSDVPQVTGVVAALGRLDAPPVVAVGGSHAMEVADHGGALILPERLDEAVRAVGELAGARLKPREPSSR